MPAADRALERGTPDAGPEMARARAVPKPAGAGRPPHRLHPSVARVLALQRSIGNGAVARLAAEARAGGERPRTLQRKVMIADGKTRVREAHYTTGKGKSIGSRRLVASLIADGVKRAFTSEKEMESYADGGTDYIGDVKTKSAGTFWYRLPRNKLTVLGELHHNADGNVEDVIEGLGTSRFKYEPFNEIAGVKALGTKSPGTQARLDQLNKGMQVGPLVDRKLFNPDLENIVIKALTGTSIVRNEYIAGKPDRTNKVWKSRKTAGDYSYGERAALYLSMAIHIASDVAQTTFGPPNFVESLFVASARKLKDAYVPLRNDLDPLMRAKDADDLIGIYDLTAPGNFANLPPIEAFTVAFHEYGSRYIEQLGAESGNAELEKQGGVLAADPGAQLEAFSPAREEIMWEKIKEAKGGYLLVGMGDAHRVNLRARLDGEGIPHERVDEALVRQRDEVAQKWVN